MILPSDGKFVFGDKTIEVWDSNNITKNILLTFTRPTIIVYCFIMQCYGKNISLSVDNTIRIWDCKITNYLILPT